MNLALYSLATSIVPSVDKPSIIKTSKSLNVWFTILFKDSRNVFSELKVGIMIENKGGLLINI
ncbi:hypothetical protein GCM10023330_24210 [Litoribaculum gwangyangense]|uniref:Uncharacterized protein n=1 Tax=Litoribaculum gwangyangense TaxID=1130722 RepID=A0ABP9CPV8_9FLAO